MTQRKGVKKTMLNALRNFNADGTIELEDAVALAAFARQMQTEFSELGVEPPAWLPEKADALRREIKVRNSDAIQRKLRELKARREALDDATTKREKLDAEIARLTGKASAV